MSELKVNKVTPRSGTTVTLGDSGDTITIPSGATIDLSSATQTGVGGTNTPAFFVRLSPSSQNIAASSVVKIQLADVLIDTNSAFDNVTNYRFTVPSGEGGRYSISYQIGADNFSATRLIALIKKNDSIISESEDFNSSSALNHTGGSFILDLIAGDYLELFGFQNSGVTKDIRGGTTFHTFFSGFKLI